MAQDTVSKPGAPTGRRATARASKRKKYDRREALAGYLFITPWIIGFIIFTLGTMVYSLFISFSHFNLATNRMRPAGLDNYRALLEDPRVMSSLGNKIGRAHV